MRKCRLLIAVLVVILMLASFVGCEEKDSKNSNVEISCTEQYVTIYTEEECSVNLCIVVKSEKNTETVSRKFTFTGNRTRNLTIGDFTDKYNNTGAIILDAYCEEPMVEESIIDEETIIEYKELHRKSSIATFLLGIAITIPAVIYVLTYSKKPKKNSYTRRIIKKS